nr:hypothetical protein [Tanacetum cinerariifolium]
MIYNSQGSTLPIDALPIALSPGYVADSDSEENPKVDPKKDPVEYPADEGDNVNDESSGDDDHDDDDDDEQEAFKADDGRMRSI